MICALCEKNKPLKLVFYVDEVEDETGTYDALCASLICDECQDELAKEMPTFETGSEANIHLSHTVH